MMKLGVITILSLCLFLSCIDCIDYYYIGTMLPNMNPSFSSELNGTMMKAAYDIGVEYANKYVKYVGETWSEDAELVLSHTTIGYGDVIENITLARERLWDLFVLSPNYLTALMGPTLPETVKAVIDDYDYIMNYPDWEIDFGWENYEYPFYIFSPSTPREERSSHYIYRITPSVEEYCGGMIDSVYGMGPRIVNIIYSENDLYTENEMIACRARAENASITVNIHQFPQDFTSQDIKDIITAIFVDETIEFANVLLLPAQFSDDESVESLIDYITAANGFRERSIWIFNEILHRFSREYVYEHLPPGSFYVDQQEAPFVDQYYYQKRMAEETGVMDFDQINRYRPHFDAIVSLGYVIYRSKYFYYYGYNSPTVREVLFDWFLPNIDFMGSESRVSFRKNDKNHVDIVLYNIVYQHNTDTWDEGNTTVVSKEIVAKWGRSNFFRWSVDKVVILGNYTVRMSESYTSNLDLTNNVPNQQNKWVMTPQLGFSPESTEGTCVLSFSRSQTFTWVHGYEEVDDWDQPNIESHSYFFIYGGRNYEEYFNDLHLLQLRDSRYISVHPSFSAGDVPIRPPSAFHTCQDVADGEAIYVFGGIGEVGQFLDSTWMINLENREWVQMESLNRPKARIGSTFVYHEYEVYDGDWTQYFNKKFLVLYGGRSPNRYLSDVWFFELSSNTWTESTELALSDTGRDDTITMDIPHGRTFHSMILTAEGDILVWGGQTDFESNTNSLSNELWFMNFTITEDVNGFEATHQWVQLIGQENTPQARYKHGGVIFDNNIYILFGLGYVDSDDEEGGAVEEIQGDFYHFDISFLGDLKDEFVLVNASKQYGDEKKYVIEEAVIWNRINYTTSGSDVISRRYGFAFSAQTDKVNTASEKNMFMFIYGGKNDVVGDHSDSEVTDLYTYNPLTEQFTLVHKNYESPRPMARFTTFMMGDSIYCLGGLSSNRELLNTVYKFRIPHRSWEKLSITGDIPSARYDSCGVVMNSQLVYLGGVDEQGNLQDEVWSFHSFMEKFSLMDYSPDNDLLPPPMSSHSCTVYNEYESSIKSSLLSLKNTMVVFGGYVSQLKVENVNTLYFFHSDDRKWTKSTVKNPSDGPPSLLQCNSFIRENVLYLEGCMSRERPQEYIYALDLVNVEWMPQKYFYVPRDFRSSRHSLIHLGDDEFAYVGGYVHYVTNSNMFVKFNFKDFVGYQDVAPAKNETAKYFEYVTTSGETSDVDEVIFPIDSQQCHYYRSRIYCIGGEKGEMMVTKTTKSGSLDHNYGTVNPNGVTADVLIYNFEPVCHEDMYLRRRRSGFPTSDSLELMHNTLPPTEKEQEKRRFQKFLFEEEDDEDEIEQEQQQQEEEKVLMSSSNGFSTTGTIVGDGEPSGLGCRLCSPGTYVEESSCHVCPRGEFSKSFHQTECDSCPRGYFGVSEGGSSVDVCLPCSFGTYADEVGSSECQKCPSGMHCPMGAMRPYLSDAMKKQYPVITFPTQYEKDFVKKTIIYSIIYSAAGLVILTILLVNCCVLGVDAVCPCCSGIECVLMFNLLFGTAHGTVKNEKGKFHPAQMVSKKTIFGSCFSLLALYVILCAVIGSLIIYNIGIDDMETRSLVPNVLVVTEKTKRVDLYTSLILNDYTSTCDVGDENECSSSITYKFNNFYNDKDSRVEFKCVYTDQINNRSPESGGEPDEIERCNVIVNCYGCQFDRSFSTYSIEINVKTENSASSRYNYDVGVTTGYADNPNKISSISGSVNGREDLVFRGLSPPTRVNFLVIPTHWKRVLAWETPEGIGYHLDYIEEEDGAQKEISDFHEDNGFAFEYTFRNSEYTIEITRYNEHTWYTFVPNLLGSCVGMIGLIAIFLRIVECVFKCCRFPNEYSDWKNMKKRNVYVIKKLLMVLGVIDPPNVEREDDDIEKSEKDDLSEDDELMEETKQDMNSEDFQKKKGDAGDEVTESTIMYQEVNRMAHDHRRQSINSSTTNKSFPGMLKETLLPAEEEEEKKTEEEDGSDDDDEYDFEEEDLEEED